ncbi:MAG: glycosyltransferase [Kofleriaceae bacterium]|nr:glycosyltransferase [Kofleriaceae bacterium]
MKKPNVKAVIAKLNVAAVRDLKYKRWGVKKRPRPEPVQPLIVIAAALSSTQVTWLRQLARVKRLRVFAFVQTSCVAPFAVLISANLPTIDEAVAVVRTMVHTRNLRLIPVLRVEAGATVAALGHIVMQRLAALPIVPATCFPSLAEAKATAAVDDSPRLALLLCGEPNASSDGARSDTKQIRLLPGAAIDTGPRVSIVMTSYNDAAFIAQALASLCAQTYRNLEIIVVDDASSDASPDIVRAMASNDARIRLITLPHNQGLFAARNIGMAAATGEFVTFQDADDVSRIDRIARCVAAIGTHDYLYGLFVRTLPDGTLTPLNAPSIYQEGIITLFFKRALLDGVVGYFDPLRVVSDSEYIERFRALRLHACYLPEVLYFARLREGSLTTTRGPLAIYTVDGQITKSAPQAAYVKEYRRVHRRRGALRWDADPTDRLFAAGPTCLGGNQQRWFNATFPTVDAQTHPLVLAHAADTLVRRDVYGSKSLRTMLASIDAKAVTAPRVGVVIASNRVQWAHAAIANIARQTYANLSVVVVDNSQASALSEWRNAIAQRHVKGQVLRLPPPHALGACLNAGIEQVVEDVDILMKFDDDDYYAPAYVHEQVAALTQAGGIVGKFPLFYYSHAQGQLFVRPGSRPSLAASTHVAGGTLTFATDLWRKLPFDNSLTLGEDRNLIARARAQGHAVTTTSLFNHCNIRHPSQTHTWNIAEAELFAEATAVCACPWPDVPALVGMWTP